MATSPAGTAVTGASASPLILTNSKWLRMATLLLFYFTQGFPIGFFFYAVPAWMAANGATTVETAAVVGAASTPWSLKFINGFIIDRYTYLPMGRRRSWIIGAQSLIVIAFLVAAVAAPQHTEVAFISAVAFSANIAVAFQDVGIDSLAIDIMPEDERAKAAGIMFGAQYLGIAAATGMGGYLFQNFGVIAGMLGGAAIPLAIMLYGVAIRERDGEKRMPWSAGATHPRNKAIQVEAWWPLLRDAFKAILAPLSLILAPLMLLRAIPGGAFEAFHPQLFTQTAGWAQTEYTSLISSSTLLSGVIGLVIGGWFIDKIGSRAGMVLSAIAITGLLAAMGAIPQLWTESWVLIGLQLSVDFFSLLYMIAIIPVFMKLCSPAVAATQFTVYMALGNMGRPLGAALAGVTAGAGNPQWLYWGCAVGFLVILVLSALAPFPKGEAAEEAEHEVEDHVAQADGLTPKMD
ncbi:MFS transporter [Altererythrobacter lutimaris]|uniref:MFS transporter n=1 Tax=Altererythrobacter lutimaris TaxID=2743979 RepID=A0A850HEI5_9SPHN|nr:MFS transporter [Altererythrobacter lutimaris]NVE95506.1 MFS transporter [Altererythrobacter lutimaris]